MPKLTFNILKVFDNYACSYWSVYALIIITIFFFCSKIKTQVGESILETWPMMHNARTLCPSGHWRRLGQNIGGARGPDNRQLPLSQPRLHPNTASTAHPKLTRTRCHQNAPASSYHSCP